MVFDDLPTEHRPECSPDASTGRSTTTAAARLPKNNPDFAVVKEFDTGEQYGFMVQKDNANAAKIMDAFNKALKTSMADGTYKDSYKKWFGVRARRKRCPTIRRLPRVDCGLRQPDGSRRTGVRLSLLRRSCDSARLSLRRRAGGLSRQAPSDVG